MDSNPQNWRKCSSCKKDILLNAKFYECSVSTCTGQRTGYVFCSITCWEVHLPGAKHRDAGAIEKKSPSSAQALSPSESISAPKRIIVNSSAVNSSVSLSQPMGLKRSAMTNEVLVVVSKLKQYIRDISEMNTSEDVNQKLSDMIRIQCEQAVEKARADGRKTVMARDFK
jgi:hypothetical protein